jgi:hypothetical protein
LQEFFFNGQVFSLSPMVHFEWDDEKSKPIFLIKWHHINDQSVEKYILLLDNKEIYYVFFFITDFLLFSFMKYFIGKSTAIFV